MRAVVQTVSEATVTVEGDAVGKIKDGLLVLVGATHNDTEDDAVWLARKIWQLRIMDSDVAASDVDAPILVVSQFTLYADTRKGRRPSYMDAAGGDRAEPLVEAVVAALRDLGATVETGRFGAYMRVSSVNVGPRTILLER